MQRDYADARLHEMCQNTEQKEVQAIEQLVFKESTKDKGRDDPALASGQRGMPVASQWFVASLTDTETHGARVRDSSEPKMR